MPLITNADEIISHADIVDVVARRVPGLTQRGKQFKALCPFHREKTPSFTVTPDKQIYHCFGCQRGGDAARFLTEFEGCTFPEALEILAADYGITVQYDKTREKNDGAPTRSDLYGAVASACEWYQAELEKNATAVDYLDKRGFNAEMRARIRLGYARASSVVDCGWDRAILTAAGILAEPKSPESAPLDPLSGRITIPLHDSLGRVVAFTGRKLSDDTRGPKYINTRETPIWSKSQCLYGYRETMDIIRRDPQPARVHILEGQLKTRALIEANLPAVSPGGTGLTDHQAHLISRLNPAFAYICPDPDDAGIQAAIRNARVLRNAKLNVKIARLQIPADMTGKIDPDDLMAADIAIRYDYLNFVPWLLEITCGTRRADPDAAHLIRNEIIPIIRDHPDPLKREAELRELSSLTGFSELALDNAPERRNGADGQHLIPAEKFGKSMTPGRILCAQILACDLSHESFREPDSATADGAWWLMWIAWWKLPPAIIRELQEIYRLQSYAAHGRMQILSAVRERRPDRLDLYTYWLSQDLPDATPDGIRAICDEIQTNKNGGQSEKINP